MDIKILNLKHKFLLERGYINMNPKEYLNIIHVAEKLKDTPRHCTTSKGRVDSA